MNRVILVIALALSAGACAHLPSLPELAAPATAARVDAAPAEREASFSVTLSAPLSELEALLRDQLTLPSAPDWQLVSEPEQSPEVEVRYEAELLAPEIAIDGQTLILKLQVAYFGSLRARVHTPFGWLGLTKNTRWGDRDHRGLIEVEIRSALELGADYQLRAHSALHDVRLTAPPIDTLCAGGAFKVCVPADVAARPIHRELERRIRDQVENGLARVDEQVAERASLARVAQQMWNELWSAPVALANGERLQLRPRALSLSLPFVSGDQLAITVGINAVPVFVNEPASAAPALPELVVGAPPATLVPLTWVEPLAAISSGLSASVALVPRQDEQTPTAITLLGPAPSADRFLVALAVERKDQKRTVYAEASLVCEGESLKLGSLALNPESQNLLTLARVDAATFLSAASAASYRPSAALDQRIRSLRALLAASVAPLPSDALANTTAQLTSARAAQDGILVEAELK